jgi:hypothetical protein
VRNLLFIRFSQKRVSHARGDQYREGVPHPLRFSKGAVFDLNFAVQSCGEILRVQVALS